jgi:hypothetical protein
MNRKLTGALGALFIGGTLLGSLALAQPAQADFFREVRRNHSSRWRDSDHDGIPNYRDHSPYRSNRYYRNGRWYDSYSVPRRGKYGDMDRDGVRNKWDRDRDGDGRRNKRDDHPSNRRRR